MSRKLTLLAAVPIAIAACNLMTGTEQPSTTISQKACLDDGTVQITAPSQLPICPGVCTITWNVENVCSPFQPEVLVSIDDGDTWLSCGGCKPNALRHLWPIPSEMAGQTALLQVHVRYDNIDLTDTIEVPIVAPQPRRRSRDEHD